MKKIWTLALLALFLAGCATTSATRSSDGFRDPDGKVAQVPMYSAQRGYPHIVVFIREQAFAAYNADGTLANYNGQLLKGFATTGGLGNETPIGTFPIIFRKADHFSSEFKDNEGQGLPMPFTLRFTERGHALHAGYHYDRRGNKLQSHGCVRVGKRELAGALFAWVGDRDVKVIVSHGVQLHYASR